MRAARVLVLVLCAAAGCARVRPWQREVLAERTMRLDKDPRERALDRTIDKTQYEGTMGGGTNEGSGCGCN